LLYCTRDYNNKEIIVVDNASVEEGTKEYLDEKEAQGVRVIRQSTRNPSNEFAIALNTIVRESSGEFICPLQGDSQFVINGTWLHEYVRFFSEHRENIGCIMFDAQRSVRNKSDKFSIPMGQRFEFFYSLTRNPICGAADTMYSREMLEQIYPWNESNLSHEGGADSETKMLQKVRRVFVDRDIFCVLPKSPVSLAIYTDPRGTNARVRDNKRYGAYWPAKIDDRYYEIYDFDNINKKLKTTYVDYTNIPYGIEIIANPIGWEKPLDGQGNWLKNPINPDTAPSSDFVILYEDTKNTDIIAVEEDYLDDWLDT